MKGIKKHIKILKQHGIQNALNIKRHNPIVKQYLKKIAMLHCIKKDLKMHTSIKNK